MSIVFYHLSNYLDTTYNPSSVASNILRYEQNKSTIKLTLKQQVFEKILFWAVKSIVSELFIPLSRGLDTILLDDYTVFCQRSRYSWPCIVYNITYYDYFTTILACCLRC